MQKKSFGFEMAALTSLHSKQNRQLKRRNLDDFESFGELD